jgi:hypothetical protein
VHYDYDKDTDFTNYSTYNYYSEMNSGLSELDTRRLLRAVDSTMQIHGILYSEEPDFLINIQSASYQIPQNSSVGVGVGGTGGNVGGSVAVGIPLGQSNLEREIIFDLIDTQKEYLFWQAISISSIRENASPHEREKRISAMVMKVFDKYPPVRSKNN